jgi:hypothetical protein
MSAQSSPEKLPRLNWRKRLPGWAPDWLGGSPAKASANGSVKGSPGSLERSQSGQPVEVSLDTSAATATGSPARSPASSPAGSPDGSPANGSVKNSDDLPPLTICRIGDTVRIDRPPDEKIEWTNQDFARLFLLWLATEYPSTQNGWVSVLDIETEFFDRFQEADGCHYLACGALYRGLGKVTKKRERTYTDYNGKRCSMTEYKVPKAASNVVDITTPERKRA